MNLFATLLAQTDDPLSAIGGFLPIVLLFVAFYFLLIRPQRKRAKAQRELLGAIAVDDRVVTIGGLHGTVRLVDEDVVHLEIAPDTIVTFAKAAVARRIVDADAGAVETADDE